MDDEQDVGGGASPGVEQFQRAALEAVRAARAMLDAAEAMIQDPSTLETVVRTAAGAARAATETVAGFASAAGDAVRHEAERREGAGGSGDEPGDDDGGYETIRVD